MIKMITFCDYCGKKIDAVYGLVPLRLLDRDRDIWEMDKETSTPDMCLDCMVNIRSAIAPEALSKKLNLSRIRKRKQFRKRYLKNRKSSRSLRRKSRCRPEKLIMEGSWHFILPILRVRSDGSRTIASAHSRQ